jgi:hypothetical protein
MTTFCIAFYVSYLSTSAAYSSSSSRRRATAFNRMFKFSEDSTMKNAITVHFFKRAYRKRRAELVETA